MIEAIFNSADIVSCMPCRIKVCHRHHTQTSDLPFVVCTRQKLPDNSEALAFCIGASHWETAYQTGYALLRCRSVTLDKLVTMRLALCCCQRLRCGLSGTACFEGEAAQLASKPLCRLVCGPPESLTEAAQEEDASRAETKAACLFVCAMLGPSTGGGCKNICRSKEDVSACGCVRCMGCKGSAQNVAPDPDTTKLGVIHQAPLCLCQQHMSLMPTMSHGLM